MTDTSFLEHLLDKQTNAMELHAPSTDDLDLMCLPERLDDMTWQRVTAIGRSRLPDLPQCDRGLFSQALRTMLAVLPRRGADDLSGELFVAAYERALSGRPADQITFLRDQSIIRCKWFPTVAECLEIMDDWRRDDEAVRRKAMANNLTRKERRAREDELYQWDRKHGNLMTQADVDKLPPPLVNIGIKAGWLQQDESGQVTLTEVGEADEDGGRW